MSEFKNLEKVLESNEDQWCYITKDDKDKLARRYLLLSCGLVLFIEAILLLIFIGFNVIANYV